VNDDCVVPKFQVYRKPQFTGISINNGSLHPMAQKLSSIQATVTRMLRLPLSPQAREHETCIIEQIAAKNELRIDVRQFIKIKQLREILSSSRTLRYRATWLLLCPPPPPDLPAPPRFWVRLPYLGPSTHAVVKEI